jgi:hypothetical protein
MKFDLGKDDELRIEVDYKKATQIRVSCKSSAAVTCKSLPCNFL